VCAAAATVTFGNDAAVAYVAEDFTTVALRDSPATTADWRTDIGAAEATRSEFGTGRDGALAVPASAAWNLNADVRPCAPSGPCRGSPDAPAVRVVGVDAAAVSVEGDLRGFAPGDEALLIALQGASASATASAGAWELFTVASVAEGRVAFTTPVLGTYGETPGAPLGGQRIALQRVPHFTTVDVPAGAALTAAAWDGQLGGVVAFRASGTVSVAGAIHADAIGYRAGSSANPLQGQAGESFGGQPGLTTGASRNLGGGGGGYNCGDPYHLNQLDTWYGSGGSYGSAGISTCAQQGAAYGTPSLARLLFGSGSGTQSQNTHSNSCAPPVASPQAGRCPGESYGSLPAATYPYAGNCGTNTTCSTTFSICGAETRNVASANQPYDTGCQSGSCTDTFATCTTKPMGGSYSIDHPAAARPCTTSSCTNTFATCGHTSNWADSPYPGVAPNDCATKCPGTTLTTPTSCYYCGCSRTNPRLCNIPTCNSVYTCDIACYGGDCGNSGSTTGFFGQCDNANSTCSAEPDCPGDSYGGTLWADQWCNNNCNVFGANCDCHYMCVRCWDGPAGANSPACNSSQCNSCSVCSGCQTNPGCATNPGCVANPGCATCGGLTGNDGSRCDITNPGNTCRCPLPWQATAPGGRGGGIVFVSAASVQVAAGGRISARGGDPGGSSGGVPIHAGGSGGSLWLRTGALALAPGGTPISAAGGVGGGAGRIRLERASGTDPVATNQIAPPPFIGAFALPAAQSKPMLPPAIAGAGKRATAATLVATRDAPDGIQAYSFYAAGSGWLSTAPGGPQLGFGAATDVRWRVDLTPQRGRPARTMGLVWMLRLQ